MKRGLAVLAVVLATCYAVNARDAAALKADLEGIIPAGKTIRLAYFKADSGGIQAFPWATGTRNTIYVVDSKDGVIRQLYPKAGSAGQKLCNICLSADGQKVLFYNRGSGSSGWVNFDGSSNSVNTVNCAMNEYWRNPADGSDHMVLVNGDCVNIMTKKVEPAGVSGVNIGSAMTCKSDDGKVLMMQDADKGFGFYEFAAKKFTSRAGGCQPSMRAGLPYEFNINPSGHAAMTVYNLAAAGSVRYETTNGASAFVASKGQTGTCEEDNHGLTQEGTRFTQHRDYATFILARSKANPILAKIGSPLKFVYIEDNLSACVTVGDMDAVILPPETSAAKDRRIASAIRGNSSSSYETFTLDGRRVKSAAPAQGKNTLSGVILNRFSNGTVEKICR